MRTNVEAEKRLTREALLRLLDYDPATGVFTWRVDRRGTAKAGTLAGRIEGRGYRQIRVFGRRFMAARLAWLYVTGEWPSHDVDHRNRQRDDNRFENLRPATRKQNSENSSPRQDHGVKGVHFDASKRKWRAYITHFQKKMFLGTFSDFADAVAARKQAEARLFTHAR